MMNSTPCLTLPASRLATALAAASLVACAAGGAPGSTAPESTASREAQVGQAVVSPLSDLNLVKAEIPGVLAAAQKDPYGAPADRSCATLAREVAALDAVLGTDLDAPPTAGNPGLIERGSSAAGNAAVGALRGAAEGVVPFRGWVRKLSGAERYAREVAAAIAAGSVRRSYLKGLGQAAACEPPAAPRRGEATTQESKR